MLLFSCTLSNLRPRNLKELAQGQTEGKGDAGMEKSFPKADKAGVLVTSLIGRKSPEV